MRYYKVATDISIQEDAHHEFEIDKQIDLFGNLEIGDKKRYDGRG